VPIQDLAELVAVCRRGFATAELHKTVAFGLNMYSNAMFMRQGYHKRKLCDTSFFGIKNTELRFDPRMILLDDTDMCARIIKRYGAFISIEDVVAVHDRFAPGGCSETWAVQENKARMLAALKKRHGDIFNIDPKKENSVTLKRGRKGG